MDFGEIKYLLERNLVCDKESCYSEISDPSNLSLNGKWVHGGVSSFMLDQLLADLANRAYSEKPNDPEYVTAKLEIKYVRTVWPNQPIEVKAEITKKDPRLVELEGYIKQGEEICVKAEGKFMRAKK